MKIQKHFNVEIGAPTFGSATLTNTTGIVTITDNDTADVIVSAMSTDPIAENGGTSTFTVVLDSQPLGNVTVPITSTVAECTLDGGGGTASLIFTSGDWNIPQTMTVTAVAIQSHLLTLVTLGWDTLGAANAPSDTTTYGLVDPPDRSVAITNDDTAVISITVDPSIDEDGTGTFTATLAQPPWRMSLLP